MRLLTLLIAPWAATANSAQKPLSEGSSTNNPFSNDFKAFAEELMNQWKVPGMSIAVVDGDDIFAEGFGTSGPNTSTTPETLFFVGSTSKAHAAATLAHLIDTKAYPELTRGWQTPISSIIRDDFVLQDEWATNHLTLEDAVSHRTGMARHDNSWHNEVDGRPATIQDVVRNLRNLPLSSEPRVEFHYCNLMFLTLSHAIETISGKWLGHVIRDAIWQPLGMKTTYMSIDDVKEAKLRISSSYQWTGHQYIELPILSIDKLSGAGGIISNVLDFSKWLRCLIDESGPFSKSVHTDIRTPRFIFSGLPSSVGLYGLGWVRTTVYGYVAYAHDGSTLTHESSVIWFPDLRYGIVALGNGALSSNNLEAVVARRLIEDKLGVASTWPALNDEYVCPFQADDANNTRLKRRVQAAKDDIRRADQILYPDAPKIPSALEPIQFAGTFFEPGYGTMKLVESSGTLSANRTELAWGEIWDFNHVSGDYWTLRISMLGGITGTMEFHAARFIVGVDGNVEALEVRFYDRAEQVHQGTVQFKKLNE